MRGSWRKDAAGGQSHLLKWIISCSRNPLCQLFPKFRGKPMLETIKSGTILIKEDTALPSLLPFKSEPCVPGWKGVANLDGYELDRQIRGAGWNLFYLANEIKTIVFGFHGQERIRRAIERIVSSVEMKKFNVLEITCVASKRFLGVPYVSVSAHPRHIQQSMFLFQVRGFQDSGSGKADHLLDPVPAFAATIHARPEERILPLSWDNNSTSFEGAFR